MSLRRWSAIGAVAVILTACYGESGMDDREARRQDLEVIARLHQRDAEAARRGDAEALAALWTEEVVMLPPGEPVRRGRDDALEALRRKLHATAGWETVEYELMFEGVGGRTFRGTARNRATGELTHSGGKLLRVLHQEGDGDWRVHRSIWNVDPRAPDQD